MAKTGRISSCVDGARLSVLIPTLGRGSILLDSLHALLRQRQAIGEIVIIDQTAEHDPDVAAELQRLEAAEPVHWLRYSAPSIPRAMNLGLREARHEIVLFLDDDIVPQSDLVAGHHEAHREFPDAWAVVGQVLQPGEEAGARNGYTPRNGLRRDLEFPFWSNERAWVSNVMAGNLSVKRDRALAIGGFDENFAGVAYRFETEFARRLVRAGGKILFEPRASIRHLQAARGGTRTQGSHLTSASPRHGMGDYYFAMQEGWNWETIAYMLRRPIREVSTKFHMQHPWYMPVKLVGEARAFGCALTCWRRGPRLLTSGSAVS